MRVLEIWDAVTRSEAFVLATFLLLCAFGLLAADRRSE